MFRFVVRRLHWLSRIPGLPQVFDAMLLAWTVTFHRKRVSAMEALEKAAFQIPGIQPGIHRMGGTEFVLSGRELGHLHGNGLLDVLVGSAQARALIKEQRAKPHHVFGDSAWVSFYIKDHADIPNALGLIRLAMERRL